MDESWTLATLKAFFDQRLADAEKALVLASSTIDRRLGVMNEWREQLARERATYITRSTYDERHAAVEAKVEAIEDRVNDRVSAIERWQWKIIGALMLVAVILPTVTAVIVFELTHRAH